VQNRVRGPGHFPRSSTWSSKVLPDATRANISGTPAGMVFSMCSTVPGHSTSPRGAWTTKSWSRGTIRASRMVMAWLSLPPDALTLTSAPRRIMSRHSDGM